MEDSKYWRCAFGSALIVAFSLVGEAFANPQQPPANSSPAETGKAAEASATGSSQAPAEPIVPKDAREMLLAAAQVNGLESPGLKPWHILVSYDKYDEDGDNVDSGTYEEYWVSPKQYRLSYSSQDFTQTDIATEDGLFRTGEQKWPGELQTRVRDEFVRPMFREMDLQFAKPEKKTREFGKVKLPCVMLPRKDTNMVVSENGLSAFCFEPNTLVLRLSKGGMGAGTVWDQTVYDNIVNFQGRYIAHDVQVTRGGKLFLKLHVEKLASIAQIGKTDFSPPPSAVPVGQKRVVLDGRVVMLDYQLHQEMPQYGNSVRPPGGEATMRFVISKDGRVTEAQFVEGTAGMRKPLEEALKKNVYRPFILRGEPVEVEVTQKYIYQVYGR